MDTTHLVNDLITRARSEHSQGLVHQDGAGSRKIVVYTSLDR